MERNVCFPGRGPLFTTVTAGVVCTEVLEAAQMNYVLKSIRQKLQVWLTTQTDVSETEQKYDQLHFSLMQLLSCWLMSYSTSAWIFSFARVLSRRHRCAPAGPYDNHPQGFLFTWLLWRQGQTAFISMVINTHMLNSEG